MNIKWLSIITGALLILAIPPWNYSYYIFLRWVVLISAVILAYGYGKSKHVGWAYVFGGIAVLFNPLIPFHLTKSVWVIIDLVTATSFFLSAYSIKKKA